MGAPRFWGPCSPNLPPQGRPCLSQMEKTKITILRRFEWMEIFLQNIVQCKPMRKYLNDLILQIKRRTSDQNPIKFTWKHYESNESLYCVPLDKFMSPFRSVTGVALMNYDIVQNNKNNLFSNLQHKITLGKQLFCITPSTRVLYSNCIELQPMALYSRLM